MAQSIEGGVVVVNTLSTKNNGDYPLVMAESVQMKSGENLEDKIADLELSGGGVSEYVPPNKVEHGTSDTTFTLPPNEEHTWGEVSELNITLQEGESNKANVHCFSFTSGITPTVLSITPAVTMTKDIEQNGRYTIVVFNEIAAVGRSEL